MRRPLRLALWGALVLATGACSFWLDFGGEGLPCDDHGGCAAGYTCRGGTCAAADPGEPCGGCGAGRRCLPSTNTCVEDSCANRRCGAGYGCVEAAAGTRCEVRLAPELGHPCDVDADCQAGGAGRLCLHGAVPSATGALRTGVCVEPCGDTGGCTTAGAACTSHALALDAGTARLCTTPGLLWGCATSAECGDHGLVCTLFDHAALGPLAACDAPLDGGAAAGEPCVSGADGLDGGALCANGLCAPQISSAAPARCTELCDGTCSGAAGAVCTWLELGVASGTPARAIPACTQAVTGCSDCTAGAVVCGADAPRCTALGERQVCLAACTPGSGQSDGGAALECAPGYSCQVLPAGPRCVPVGGACP